MNGREPPFADSDWYSGVGIVIAAVIGPVGIGVGWLLTWMSNRRKNAIAEWQEAARYEREQRYRAEARNASMDASFRRLFTLYTEEHSRAVDFYSMLVLIDSVVKRQNARLTHAGTEPEVCFDLPPRPQKDKNAEAAFLMNTVEQERIAAGSLGGDNKQLPREAAVDETPHS